MRLEIALLAAFVVPLLPPLFMRSGRALAVCAAVLLALIVAGFKAHEHAMSGPNYHDTPGDAFVMMTFVIAGCGLAVGVVLRTLILAVGYSMRRRD